jgi:hypothetical protein
VARAHTRDATTRHALVALETVVVGALAVVFAFAMPGSVGFGTNGGGLVLTVAWILGLALLSWRESRR